MHHEGSASGSAPIPLSHMLQDLSSEQSNSCIFRVHKALRKVNEEAYEPNVIAIGPYHRNKKSLQMMEEQKLRYLNSLLQMMEEQNQNVEVYISAMREEEKQVQNFYAEPLDLTSDELAKMMVLDGCFIILLMFQKEFGFQRNDLFLQLPWLSSAVKRDLMLYENQIPFFILRKLCGITKIMDENKLIDLIFANIAHGFPHDLHRWTRNQNSHGEVKSLLDLIYLYWQPFSFPGADSNEDIDNNNSGITILCAIELQEAGVIFEKKETENFMNISFKHGILQIPPLDVNDHTEPFLRNLLAHEQYCRRGPNTYVADYLHFLDCLIDSAADVQLLRQKGIIENNIGDNELVAQMFNKIVHSIVISHSKFYYVGIFKRVNGYCNKHKNQWMAKLRSNYFNSPWGVISIIAASTLLLLTLTQTIFTVFPRK